jgi:hypothetical protein
MKNRDSSVGMATRYGLDGSVSYSRKGPKIFLHSTASRPAQEPARPHIQRVPGALSSELKPPGLDADKSLPPTTEVKNTGTIPPLPHTFTSA